MAEITEFFKLFIIYFVLSAIAKSLYRNRDKKSFAVSIWKKFSLKMFTEVILIMVITILFFLLLYNNIFFLRYGWLNLFIKNGGNILFLPVQKFVNLSSVIIKLSILLFALAIFIILPFEAFEEEKIFRKGFIEWKDIIRQSVKFGFMHLIMGIPTAVGISLIIPGLFYGYKYKKAYEKNIIKRYSKKKSQEEAVIYATVYHTLWNSILVGFLLLFSVYDLIAFIVK